MHYRPQTKRKVYEYIAGYIATHYEPPTLREIGKQFDFRSSASVHEILVKLERDGLITREPRISRGIRIVQRNPGIGWLDR